MRGDTVECRAQLAAALDALRSTLAIRTMGSLPADYEKTMQAIERIEVKLREVAGVTRRAYGVRYHANSA